MEKEEKQSDKETLRDISAICVDYDGNRTVESLKELIDEIKWIADTQLKE